MFRALTPTQRTVDLVIAGAYAVLFAGVPLVRLDLDLSVLLPTVVLAGALAVRRLAPTWALWLAWVAAVTQMGLAVALGTASSPNLFDAAIPAIVYAVAAYGTRGTRWAAFASAVVGALVAAVFVARADFAAAILHSDTSDLSAAMHLFAVYGVLTAVTLLLAWTAGLLVRTAQQSRRNREEANVASQLAAAEQERTRIARDMHDVVAHSLAVVIAQSDGARLLRKADPEAVDEALETIAATSRAALADVRVLLQQLRYEGTTTVQPGLADLDALVEQFRSSGLDVRLDRSGAVTEVGTSVQLAAFRIVQESLTNALRHGDVAAGAEVVLARTPHGLDVAIVNALATARTARENPTGHGLVGMRERAQTVSGRFTAEADGDRFVVRAFLPVGATAQIAIVR